MNKVECFARLMRLFFDAPADIRQEGLVWYELANRWTYEVGMHHNVQPSKVAGVTSALSPSVEWSVNMKDAAALIDHYMSGGNPDDLKVSTYGQNKAKAWDIISGVRPPHTAFSPKTGRKTWAFYHAIANPTTSLVTVDRHMLSAWYGEKRTDVRKSEYDDIERAVQVIAQAARIPACAVQATIWLHYKQLNN